jgi:mannose-6-phosphate isomerase-like protein (cupin superfamily)
MARHEDLYENAVTGERAVVLRGDEAPGKPLLAHLTVRPGGFVAGEHVHPALTERFTVVSGTLSTRIDGVEGRLEPGEQAVVPPGVRHDWWNAGDDDAHVIVELSPPDPRFEQAIATGFALANTGRTDPKGRPSLLQAALMAQEFADVIQFTKPPAWVQRLLFGVLAPIARWRGYKGIYPELLGPHGIVEADPRAMAAAGMGSMIES